MIYAFKTEYVWTGAYSHYIHELLEKYKPVCCAPFKKKPAKIKIILSIEFFNALMQIFKQCLVIRWKNYSLWNWNVLESNFDGLKENKKIPTQVIVMDFLKPGFYLFAYTAVLQSCFRIHMCTVEMLLWSYVYMYVVHVALPCYCNQK